MADHTIKYPYEYKESLQKLTPQDPAHADLLNQLFSQLINNDVFLHEICEVAKRHMEQEKIHVTEELKERWNQKASTDLATQEKEGLLSSVDKTKLDSVKENAEENQNAIANVKVGNTTISSNGKSGTLELTAGTNISMSADNATKKVTIQAPESIKNPHPLAIQTNGTHQFTYDGSVAGTVNITPANIGLGNVNNTADSQKSVNYANSAGNADTVDGLHAVDVVRQNCKHLAGQGLGGGYSFVGDGAEDTGMFSDSDGDLYFKKNGVRHDPITNQNIGSQSVNYANSAGNADTVDGVHASSFSRATHIRNGATGGYNLEAGSDCSATGEWCSFAGGFLSKATNNYSFAFGHTAEASGKYCFAEGIETKAIGNGSHAEGNGVVASGFVSHAEGNGVVASGRASHAEGESVVASGFASHAGGWNTVSDGAFMTAIGWWNKPDSVINGTFVIGNGTEEARSNSFRIHSTGAVYTASNYNSGGADYAEYFEWLDGNPEQEDRVGLFVTLIGEKIAIAKEGDYILGVVSAFPCILGNSNEDWQGRWEKDDFGRFLTQVIREPMGQSEEQEGEMEENEYFEREFYIQSPDYDPDKQYVERKYRPEWSAIGMLGVLSVRDDGTCKVNEYCKVGENGMGTATKDRSDGYRVISRVNENIVKIILR